MDIKSCLENFYNLKNSIYIMCRRGNNSRIATKYLLDLHFDNVINLEGGIEEYGK